MNHTLQTEFSGGAIPKNIVLLALNTVYIQEHAMLVENTFERKMVLAENSL